MVQFYLLLIKIVLNLATVKIGITYEKIIALFYYVRYLLDDCF